MTRRDLIAYLRYKVDVGERFIPFFEQQEFSTPEPLTPKKKNLETLEQFNEEISKCKKCDLGQSRNKFVFGEGNPDADIMFIGEAPGHEENLAGRPFVGEAGDLLDKILKAIDLARTDIYIANILKCHPPSNRDPLPQEISYCFPYLERQVEIIEPKLICTLGLVASQNLLDKFMPLKRLRQESHKFKGIRVIPTYHPAALLRNPGWKKFAWEDMKLLRRLYDKFGGRPE